MVNLYTKNHVISASVKKKSLENCYFTEFCLVQGPLFSIKIIRAERKLKVTCNLSWWTYIPKIISISARVWKTEDGLTDGSKTLYTLWNFVAWGIINWPGLMLNGIRHWLDGLDCCVNDRLLFQWLVADRLLTNDRHQKQVA